MKGMVLAAGLGTRFRPHTLHQPKACFPFLNIPLLYHSLFVAEKLNAKKVFVNSHHLPEFIEDAIKKYPNPRFPIDISFEPEILGNAGCLDPVRESFSNDTFFVHNADTVLIPNDKSLFEEVLQHHKESSSMATLLVMKHTQAGKEYGGVWCDQNQMVQSIGKTPPNGEDQCSPYHFVGLRIFEPEVFKYIPKNQSSEIFYEVMPNVLADGHRVSAYIAEMDFFDGGKLDNYLRDSSNALKLYPESVYLREISERLSKNDILEKPNQLISSKSKIASGTTLSNLCIIGDDVVIEEGCIIDNCLVQSGAHIKANTHLKDDLILA